MKLMRFLKVIVSLTVISVIYIHMQIQIFDLAYAGKEKEKRIHHLADNNGMVTSDILMMKSSNNLGVKLLAENSGLDFGGDQQIVRLETPAAFPGTAASRLAAAGQESSRPNMLLSLFSLKAQAEARPVE